jgi:hypothetical protein
MDFIGGIIGFLGFEGLKIYKVVWVSKKPFPPENRLLWYVLAIIGISILSGFMAVALAKGDLFRAIIIGFLVPSGIKTIFEPVIKGGVEGSSDLQVDDIHLSEGEQKKGFLNLLYELLFSFKF